ncbi:MAG: hypothetical protein RMI94_01635 [Bryobacterales bacterium]|nr:hypothetical protein [Bryobacteraceae bacterium]MDW8129221.1 hypothetical protein [Bryobacterales bacterium]
MQEEKTTGLPPPFLKTLELFGVKAAELERDLEVAPRTVIVLSGHPRHATCHRPRMIQTSDLAELKRWIGVPDEAVKGRCLLDRGDRAALAELRRGVKQAAVAEEATGAAAAASSRLDALRAHARAFLYGDSTLVATAKPLIEAHHSIFAVALWLFRKIRVRTGSVLLLGPGANVLIAGELEIEEGGQVLSLGPLTIRVATLRKTVPVAIMPPMHFKHVMALVRT